MTMNEFLKKYHAQKAYEREQQLIARQTKPITWPRKIPYRVYPLLAKSDYVIALSIAAARRNPYSANCFYFAWNLIDHTTTYTFDFPDLQTDLVNNTRRWSITWETVDKMNAKA